MTKNFFILFFINITCALSSALAQTQTIPAYHDAGLPYIRNFSPKEYNAHAYNWAITQDRRGIMYFGNGSGVLEYDGVAWRLIPLSNNAVARSLATDGNDRIYVGSIGEFGYLAPDKQGQLQYVSLLHRVKPEHRDFADIWEIRVTSQAVYFSSVKYLFQWTPDNFSFQDTAAGDSTPSSTLESGSLRIWKPKTSFHINAAFALRDTIFVQQKDIGLMKLAGDSLRLEPGGEAFADKRITVMQALPTTVDNSGLAPKQGEDKDKNYLVGTLTNGLFWYNGKSFYPIRNDPRLTAFLQNNKLFEGAILPYYPGGDGAFVLATNQKGAAVVDQQGRLRQILNEATGLQNDAVWSVYSDRSGGLWLGLSYGVARVATPSPLTIYTDQHVASIARHQGRLYIATPTQLYFLSPETGRKLQTVPGLHTDVPSLLPAHEALLAGTHDGIYNIKSDRVFKISDHPTYYLYQSRYNPDRVFAGLRDGLIILNKIDETWRLAGPIPGVSGYIQSINEETPGTLWLGTRSQGYLHVDITGLSLPPTDPGDPQNPGKSLPDVDKRPVSKRPEDAARIESYGPDKGVPAGRVDVSFVDGRTVFLTYKGLRRFDPSRQYFLPDSSLGAMFADTTRVISRVSEVRNGAVWIESTKNRRQERGIARLQADGRYIWEATPFLRLEDFGRIKAIYPDPANPGVLWLGGVDGMVRYDPSVAKDYSVDFPALVRRVIVNGDSMIFGGSPLDIGRLKGVELNYANNAMRFEFAAASFELPPANQYQFFLQGFDEDWSDWTDETQKDYTNISEGSYTFRVQAKNVYEHLSSQDHYSFTILPPWYRTWWAYGLYGIFFLGSMALIVLGYNTRHTRQLQVRTRELEAVVADRTAELAEKNAALKELNTLKSRFFANISHEFRTPLTLILGQIRSLLPNLRKERDIDKAKMALRNAGQLRRLINQLLDLSKFDARRMTLKASERNIVPFLCHLTGAFESLAEQRKIDLRFESSQQDIPVYFEQDKIEKVMHNLLSNALKFTQEGGKIQVVVGSGSSSHPENTSTSSSTEESGKVKITVRDSGIGIPKDRLAHIFDRFYQVDSSTTREHEGTGIGLALANELVQIHAGGISVESTEGFGTTFTVWLPLGKAHLQPDQIADSEGARSEEPIDKVRVKPEEKSEELIAGLEEEQMTIDDEKKMAGEAKMTAKPNDHEVILIVEDNPDMRAYISDTLVRNYRIIEAPNGEAGFTQAQEHIPNLIITDVMMPKVDGYEMTRRLRQAQVTSHIPIIMLTAKAADEDKLEGLERGVDAYLTKPFNKKELHIRVRKLIELRQQLRQQTGLKAVLQPSEIDVSSLDQQFLQRLRDVIEENIENEDFNVDDLATNIGVGKRQLQRKLKALTDLSPIQCIRTMRLQRAKQLLEKGAGNVTEVAFSVGYSDLTAFSRAFREEFNQLPSSVIPKKET